jgi:hypothetical protein
MTSILAFFISYPAHECGPEVDDWCGPCPAASVRRTLAAVETRWRPGVGQVTLVEVLTPSATPPLCLTGIVDSDGPGPVVIDLGASPTMPADRCEVVASFFTPEALYLGRGTAARGRFGHLIELDVRAMQAVQRRSAPRVRGSYPVALGAFFGVDDYVSVTGTTVDIAPGGCRVVVSERLPDGAEPTVCIQLVDDESVVAQARVLEDREDGGRWEYRLAFEDIDEPDRRRLARLAR